MSDAYWKTTGARQPWGEFDPDAGLNFSFNLADFAAQAGAALTVQGVQVIADPRLAVSSPSLAANVFTMRVDKVNPAAAADIGQFVPFTLRIMLSDGQHDDRTFYLLIRQR